MQETYKFISIIFKRSKRQVSLVTEHFFRKRIISLGLLRRVRLKIVWIKYMYLFLLSWISSVTFQQTQHVATTSFRCRRDVETTLLLCFVLAASLLSQFITKTYLYNFDPLKPHFYIAKLGCLQGYTLFFLFLLKNIDCGYSLEPPRQGGSNEYPQSMFCAEIWKISEFFIWKFSFFGDKIFSIFE